VDGREKFGTYFRDTVGQDYADQRYYGSGTGSFFTPDPGGIKAVDPRNPVSWNRYTYVLADPVNRIDPAGLGEYNCGWVFNGEVLQFVPCPFGLSGDAPPGHPMSDSDRPGNGGSGGAVVSQLVYNGFEDAVHDLENSPDCANLIGSNAGGIPYSGAGLAQILDTTPVTTSTDGGNNAVTIQMSGSVGQSSYQTAYTTNGVIYLNGNYFPDPTQQNFPLPGGNISFLDVVNGSLGTTMTAEQLVAFVFLHELSHIVDSDNSHQPTIDSPDYNKSIVKTCIH
jgi:RHS repeat-associated protein